MAKEETFDARSTATCEGRDFAVQIFVYGSHPELTEHLEQAHVYWCANGVTTGSFAAGDRWFATLEAPPKESADAIYMDDIRRATGGDRVSQVCD